jgi:ribonuclease P protein component
VPSDLSFPKTRRLTRTAEFDRVRQLGKVWRGGLITLVVAPALEFNEKVRVGIIASRNVGSAVVRNRVRRRLREVFRRHQLDTASGVWLVIIASARAARATYRQLEDEYLRLAERASILAP